MFRFFLISVLLLGAGWRFVDFDRFPVPFHVMRQYHGANHARRMWLPMRPAPLENWEAAWLEAQRRPITEPPILEVLTAGAFLLAGGEKLWLGTVLASLFWLAGGFFVYDTAKRLSRDRYGGVLALGYYLLCPFSILLSRSFQPEALMIVGLAFSVWMIVRTPVFGSWRSSIGLGLACGAAVLVKPGMTLFPVAAGFATHCFGARGLRASLREPRFYAVLALIGLPSTLYVAIRLGHHVGPRIMPELLLQPAFWVTWWGQLSSTIGTASLAAAAVGAWVSMRRDGSFVLAGLLAGFAAYCMTVSWHTMTHAYYQAPMVVVAALCLAPLPRLVRAGLDTASMQRADAVGFAVALVVCAFWFSWRAAPFLVVDRGQARTLAFYEKIGDRIGRGSKVISLSEHYGLPLMHHGWLVTQWWPTLGDQYHEGLRDDEVESNEDRLRRFIQEFEPSHFVITDLRELRRQPELLALLESELELEVQERDWIAFRVPDP